MAAADILRHGEVPPEERYAARTFVALAPIVGSDNAADEATLRELIGTAHTDIRAIIAVAQIARRRGFSEVAAEAFATARRSITPDAPKEARFIAAQYARSSNDPSTVIDLLNDIVAPDDPSDALLYLAEAHALERPRKQRNKTFFDRLPQTIKRLPAYACQYAEYLLNIDEVDNAITVLKQLWQEEPEVSAHVLRLANAYQRKPDVDAFMALARGIDLSALEMSPLAGANIALMLREADRIDEALLQGLAAVRAAPNNPAVASVYIGLLIGDDSKVILAPVTLVAEDTYVRLTGPYGETRSFIIDRGPAFWGIDAYPPDHAFASRLLGKATGDTIVQSKPAGPDEIWTIVELKNKYLHALHFIMEDFEQRFAGYDAITRMSIEGEDVAPILDFVRQRAEANREFAKHYTDQHMPLEFVARMMGGDVLSFAGYIHEIGHDLFTCFGSGEERLAAVEIAKTHAGRGAVLDTYTAISAAFLNLLPTLKAHFGELFLSRTTINLIDNILARQNEKFGRESMTIAWHNGRYIRDVADPAELQQNIERLAALKADLLAHTTVRTDFLPDEASEEAASLAAKLGVDPFLPMYQAAERGVVFLSDDAPTRIFATHLAGVQGLWLQPSLIAAKEAGHLLPEAYASTLAGLAVRRHRHVSLAAQDLVLLFRSDTDGSLREFRHLALALGGPGAELFSHANAVAETVQLIFHPVAIKSQAATGILLENLIKGRQDFAAMLGYLAAILRSDDNFIAYLEGWIKGHFLSLPEVVRYYRFFDARLRSSGPSLARRPLRGSPNSAEAAWA